MANIRSDQLGPAPVQPDEETVRCRAYSIWEQEGRPNGRHREHWQQAERALQSESAAQPKEKLNKPPELRLEAPVSPRRRKKIAS